MNDKGEFFLTARDIKANTGNDAIRRLTYVTIRAYGQLKSESKVSRKDVINPILKKWRVNPGKARLFLATDKGLLREDDLFSLDVHATADADDFIRQIKDPTVKGNWKPSDSGKKRKTKTGKIEELGEEEEQESITN